MSSEASQDAARAELLELEQEISKVKGLLRKLGPGAAPTPSSASSPSAADDGGSPSGQVASGEEDASVHNKLSVTWVSTEGLPESSTPRLQLQLSSPVEERTLTPEDSTCSFLGVEPNQATLTVSGFDADIPLGSSLHDLSPLLKFDSQALDSFVEVTVLAQLRPAPPATGAATGASETDAVKEGAVEEEVIEVDLDQPSGAARETSTGGAAEDKDPTAIAAAERQLEPESAALEAADAAPDAAGAPPPAVCEVTLRLTFVPSHKDRREVLYESLNRATQRKAVAVERLRAAAVAEQRRLAQAQASAGGASAAPISRGAGPSPAVKAGFLNKKPASAPTPEPPRWKAWYDQHLGPDSMIRQIFPIARNYVTFAVVVALMHFKGQLLALPPPV